MGEWYRGTGNTYLADATRCTRNDYRGLVNVGIFP